MILAVRTDLKMGKGKIAAQCGHATLGAFKKAQSAGEYWKDTLAYWESEGQKKIVIKVKTEEDLDQLTHDIKGQGIPCYVVRDAGHTQIAAGSKTVLGIGPAPSELLDPITGEFSLM